MPLQQSGPKLGITFLFLGNKMPVWYTFWYHNAIEVFWCKLYFKPKVWLHCGSNFSESAWKGKTAMFCFLTMKTKIHEISFYVTCNAEYYCCCIYFHQFGNFTLYCWLCISKIYRAISSIQSIRPNMSLFHTDHNKSLYL